MPLKLNSTSGGSVTLQEPTTASNRTLTLPDVTATVITDSSGVLNIGSGQVYKDSSGNVGIGTSSPSSYGKLTVNDTNAKSIYVRSSSTNFSGVLLENTNSATKWQIGVEGGAYNTAGLLNIGIDGVGSKVAIDSNGTLYVNTTTKYGKVTCENSTAFDPNTSGNITNAAFGAHGSYGGGVSIIDGTQGYMLWAQSSGADFYIRRATTSSGPTGGVYISNAAGSWSSASDERLKNIIRPIENATEKLSGLRCVIGEYKDNVGNHHPFLIAQDVQAVFPEVVNQADEQGHLGMSYTDMVPILVKAVQEQQAMIEELKAKVAALEAK